MKKMNHTNSQEDRQLKRVDKLLEKYWIETKNTTVDFDEDKVLVETYRRILNNQKEQKNKKRISMVDRFARIAAVLLIPVIIYTVWKQAINNEQQAVANHTITTPAGTITNFQLNDGTTVWLNGGSKLIYPETFNGDQREVQLIGEAFFDVQHDEVHPFIVQTADINIEVLGTRFNVSAYDDDDFTTAVLEKGSIKAINNKDGRTCLLKPGHLIKIENGVGNMQPEKVELYRYTSWKDGRLIFTNEPLENVVRKLERWYNATIELKDEELKKYTYSGVIELESLGDVLEMLTITTPIRCEKLNKNTISLFKKDSLCK
ncbi:DUF4974 domain-containing protein [Puteibacter caeruleilacunae]|nr:DUF4974 domain-containing protein [Puteibacter caeruleilacunae]